jgi:Mrp family chromosome partitioning ATPase
VLIDADCSKPHLSRLFSLESEPGLLDVLRDPDAKFESVVVPTDIEGLSIAPAGKQGTDASELLASKRMDAICAALAADHPHWMIVFDSSPLLLTTEAVALAAHVGQIAFVVRANETLQPAVLAALEKLDPEKAIGCILNQAYGSGLGLQTDEYGYGAYGSYGVYGG